MELSTGKREGIVVHERTSHLSMLEVSLLWLYDYSISIASHKITSGISELIPVSISLLKGNHRVTYYYMAFMLEE